MATEKYELIVIGGSAGGLEALLTITSKLPENYSIPIIIVLHRMRNVDSNLESVFKHRCKIKNIREANEKEPIKKNTLYIAPANYHLLVEEDKTLSLDTSEAINFSRPSIDVTFESAASVYKSKLIGILLTGANADGTAGLKKIKEKKGLLIVQDPATAVATEMPLTAIRSMKVDHILDIKHIYQFLLSLK